MQIYIELLKSNYRKDNDLQFVAATVLEGISSLNEFKQSYELCEKHDPNLKILVEKFASVDNYQQALIQQLCSKNNHPAFAKIARCHIEFMNLLYFLYNKEPAHFNTIISYVTDINNNKAVFQRVFEYPRHFLKANFATNSSTESHWQTELKERFWQDQLADRFFSVLIEHPIEFHRIFTLIIMLEEQQSKSYLNAYEQTSKRLFPQFQTIFSSTTSSKSIHEAIKNVYGRKRLTGKKYISLADLAPKGALNSTMDLEYFLLSSLLQHDSLETIVAAILTDDRFNNMIYDYKDFFSLFSVFDTIIKCNTTEEKEQKDLILKIGIRVISYVTTNKCQFKRIFHHTGNNKDWSEFGIKRLYKTCVELERFFLYCVLADEDLLFSLHTSQFNTNDKKSFYRFAERIINSYFFYTDDGHDSFRLMLKLIDTRNNISIEAINQLTRLFRTLLPAIRNKYSTPSWQIFHDELQKVYDYYAKKLTTQPQTSRANTTTYICINSEVIGEDLVEWNQVKFTNIIKLTLILAFKEAHLHLPEHVMFHIIKIVFGSVEKKAPLYRSRSNEYYTKFWACDGSFNQEFQDNNKLVINY